MSILERYFLDPKTITVFLGLLAISIIAAAIIYVAIFICRQKVKENIATLLFTLALIGAISGYVGGLSRVSAVGAIIPAMLGIVSGLAVYLFGIKRSRGVTASVGLIAFAVTLFFGFAIGSAVRAGSDYNAEFRAACLRLYFDPETYATDERLKRAYGKGNQIFDTCQRFLSAP